MTKARVDPALAFPEMADWGIIGAGGESNDLVVAMVKTQAKAKAQGFSIGTGRDWRTILAG